MKAFFVLARPLPESVAVAAAKPDEAALIRVGRQASCLDLHSENFDLRLTVEEGRSHYGEECFVQLPGDDGATGLHP